MVQRNLGTIAQSQLIRISILLNLVDGLVAGKGGKRVDIGVDMFHLLFESGHTAVQRIQLVLDAAEVCTGESQNRNRGN